MLLSFQLECFPEVTVRLVDMTCSRRVTRLVRRVHCRSFVVAVVGGAMVVFPRSLEDFRSTYVGVIRSRR